MYWRNVPEARYIAHLVRELLTKKTGHTIGVVAFSEAQQGAIEAALAELTENDAEMRARLDEEMAREEDGQHIGLFVKNLENVQGDERDVGRRCPARPACSRRRGRPAG